MYFSLFYNFDPSPGEFTPALFPKIEAQIVRADRLGFDAAWVAEHHFALYGRLASPLLFLARMSAVTTRIRLGTAVVEAPYYHPLRLAEEAALVDVLSHGRLRLGVGAGAANKPGESVAFGIPTEERAARTREIVAILDQAFRRRKVDFAGEYYRFDEISLDPGPIQRPETLLWIAASNSTPEWAGERGYRLLVPRVGAAADHFRWIERYRGACTRRSGYVALLRFVFVAETEREAQEQTRTAFARYAKHDCGVYWDGSTSSLEYAELTRRLNMVVGTSEQVIDQLQAWQTEYGFDEIICQAYAAGIGQEEALRSIDLLACEVLPYMQTADPKRAARRPETTPGADNDWDI